MVSVGENNYLQKRLFNNFGILSPWRAYLMTRVWVIYLVSASSMSASASLSRWGSDWTHSSCNMSHRHEQTHHFYNSTQNITLFHKHTPTYLSAIALWVSGHYCPVFSTFVTLRAAFLEQWENIVVTPFTACSLNTVLIMATLRKCPPWNELNRFIYWCMQICWSMLYFHYSWEKLVVVWHYDITGGYF